MKTWRLFGSVLILVLVVAFSWAESVLTTPASLAQGTANQITQHGITWTFDQAYEYGQFANGDYWVVGPVTVVAIDPPSIDSGGRVVNGAMINPSPRDGATQGYDSAMYAGYGPHYDGALNVARPNGQDLSASNPLLVQPNASLVSSISLAEAGSRPQLQTAAILTVLESPAPANGFRPPYSGRDKTVRFTTDQIDRALLANLAPVSGTPDLASIERYFERPWIDHVPGWLADYHHPQDNMPNYGRNMASQVGEGGLMLHLDFSDAQKETLLIRYIQLGIDLYGVVGDGGESNWTPNGGHGSGRKWPILFAGIMLDDEEMKNIGPGDGSGPVFFGEDAQTFYVSQQDIDMTHDPDLRSCYLLEYEQGDLGLPEWGIRHATIPEADNKAWCAVYRRCCTANAWVGFVLAAHVMDAKGVWNHDALFDYQDRYMATESPGEWTRSWSDFAEDMWDSYRADYGPVWAELTLRGMPANQAIRLSWSVSPTLPATSTWQIDYVPQTGSTAFPPITDIVSPTRAYTLTGLSNYVWYTVTLNAMLKDTPFLTDTVRVMPTDHFVYLPLVARNN